MSHESNRYEYSGIDGRPRFRWPNGAKVAVYFALGIEHFSAGPATPDQAMLAGLEYGTRVGAWRLLDLFKRANLPLSILLNSAVCRHAPDLVRATQKAHCEVIAHGHSIADTLTGMDEDALKRHLDAVAAQIAATTGDRPGGWCSPAATVPTLPDLAQASGFSYLLDGCIDDQPVWLQTRQGRILALPNSPALNDQHMISRAEVSATDFAAMIVDQFDEMRETPDNQPVVMSVTLHASTSGRPFALRAFRRALDHLIAHRRDMWITQPQAIAQRFATASLRRVA